MYVALAELDVFSGLAVFYPLASTSAPVYPLPPPTSLIGALAYAYLRLKEPREIDSNGLSPAAKLLDSVVYAAAGAEAYNIVREVERIYQLVYQRKRRWRDVKDAFSVGARGLVKYLDDRLYIVYVARNKEVLDYIYGVVRIGRKESHVALQKMTVRRLKEAIKPDKKAFETIFYTPTSIALCENALALHMPKLSERNYNSTTSPELEEFYVPKGIGPMDCNLKMGGALIDFDGIYIAIPRELLAE